MICQAIVIALLGAMVIGSIAFCVWYARNNGSMADAWKMRPSRCYAVKPSEFKCAQCGDVFEKDCEGWSEQDALSERAANGWGHLPDSEMASVCDDCYKAIMGWIADQPPVVTDGH